MATIQYGIGYDSKSGKWYVRQAGNPGHTPVACDSLEGALREIAASTNGLVRLDVIAHCGAPLS